MDPAVLLERPSDGIAQVTLSRPDRLNAFDSRLIAELTTTLDALDADPTVRVVILTGSGTAFSAGLDLRGYGDDDRIEEFGAALGAFARQREIAAVAERLHRLRQPVIAAVNGAAAGGGLALVCACDVRVASTTAAFAVSFIRAGYSGCDIGVSWLLPRIVGVGHAHELMLTGRRIGAAEARRIGLVTSVVSPQELLDRAQEIAAEILRNPPASVELTKEGMWTALELPSLSSAIQFENRQQMIAAATTDAREATAAFLEKRPAVYRHR